MVEAQGEKRGRHPKEHPPIEWKIQRRPATGRTPETVLPALRSVLAGLDPDLPVRQLMTADAVIEHSSFELSLLRNMLSASGSTASNTRSSACCRTGRATIA